MLGPQILVSSTSYKILPLQKRAIPPELNDVAFEARTSYPDECRVYIPPVNLVSIRNPISTPN
jgi:hypothetical protein